MNGAGVLQSMTAIFTFERRRTMHAALLLVTSSSLAGAQSIRDTSAVAAPAPPFAVISFTPARARQGTVLRITVRPMSLQPVRDTAMSDTARVSTGTRVDLDSLRAVLDTLALRGDSTRAVAAPLSVVADTVGARDPIAVHATFFGERLHFERTARGEFTAIAAIPVDAPASARIVVTIERPGAGIDTATAPLPIARTAYKMEQLKVAPKFGQAPDSALAARIAREQRLAAEVSRRAHDTPRLWQGEFQRPRTARVTSAFGDGRQFNGAVQSRHMGLDLAGAVGAPVLATNRGVVALVGDFYYAGNAVYIDHGAGLVTAYFHLSAVDVAQGDTVTPGMRIGRVGATGRVTGPHLHWVARYGSVTVDPSSLLELGSIEAVDATGAPQPSQRSAPPGAPPKPASPPPAASPANPASPALPASSTTRTPPPPRI